MEVKLTYYKPSGKYYASGEYIREEGSSYDVHCEVDGLRDRGELPGLLKGSGRDFIIEIERQDLKGGDYFKVGLLMPLTRD